MKPTLVILAAGIGSRYGGLKQIDPVGPNGEAIIDYSIYDAIEAGYGKIIFIVRESILDDFRKFIANKFDIPMDFAIQEDASVINKNRLKPWGTGHAVLAAAGYIDEPFAVINADDFYGRDAYRKAYEFLTIVDHRDYSSALIGYKLAVTLSDHGTVSRGYCIVGDDGNLIKIQELTKIWREGGVIFFDSNGDKEELPENSQVSMNFWCFDPDILPHFKADFEIFLQTNRDSLSAEFLIPSVVYGQVKDHAAKVRVLNTSSNWFGITYREDKPYVQAAVKELVASNVYPSPVWK